MKQKIQLGEREHQDRLKGLLKDRFNTELQPLRSLETVTKKRRALRKREARSARFTKPDTMTSG